MTLFFNLHEKQKMHQTYGGNFCQILTNFWRTVCTSVRWP